MSSTVAPPTPTVTQLSATPPKPSPSRTAYRTAPDTTFQGALQAAAAEAMVFNEYSNPSAARIAAPPESQPDGQDGPAPVAEAPAPTAPGPATVDAGLWRSLSLPFTLKPGTGAPINGATPMSGAGRVDAVDPAAARAQGQAFLNSIKGFDQTSASEYDSAAQARAWGYSTCSAASLTAVLRAAGQDVKIADVMKAMPGGMTIKLGLVSRPALVNAAKQFGADASDDVTSYEALKQATDNGQPVLIDIRNGKFPEGHWIVVTGVDENGIRCADSSRYNLTSISRGELQRSWSSRGIRLQGLTPVAAPARKNVQAA
ncbi:MAG: C39 family peptidase [Chloroflexota bacterium]